jgi:hypothetical protein
VTVVCSEAEDGLRKPILDWESTRHFYIIASKIGTG